MAGEFNQSDVQITERCFADRIKKEGENVFAAVENRIHDVILTALDSVIMPKLVALVVRSIVRSSGHGPTNVHKMGQNHVHEILHRTRKILRILSRTLKC